MSYKSLYKVKWSKLAILNHNLNIKVVFRFQNFLSLIVNQHAKILTRKEDTCKKLTKNYQF